MSAHNEYIKNLDNSFKAWKLDMERFNTQTNSLQEEILILQGTKKRIQKTNGKLHKMIKKVKEESNPRSPTNSRLLEENTILNIELKRLLSENVELQNINDTFQLMIH